MAGRTRSAISEKFAGLYKILGSGSELTHSELPTLRQCLRYGLLMRERAENDLDTVVMCKSILKEVKGIWGRVNPDICLVKDKSALNDLGRCWETAKCCATNKGASKSTSEAFFNKLDKLFDIAKCKCPIYECADESSLCKGCEFKAHVFCSCPRDEKIPYMELEFILSQRRKVGERGTMQISSVDRPEAVRRKTKFERKESRAESANRQRGNKYFDENAVNIDQNDSDQDVIIGDPSDRDDPDVIYSRQSCSSENVLNVSRVGAAAIRYNVSNRATAAISTATLAAAKDAGLIRDEADIIIDQNKIRRAKSRVMKQTRIGDELSMKNSNIQCIFFDGRKDKTKYMRVGVNGELHPSERKEDHYSLCSEPGGKFLTHLTNDPNERTGTAADQIAQLMYDWVEDHGISDSLIAIGADSTNLNTGWEGGAIQFFEQKLGKKLIWLICALHTNELPLRHLLEHLDGKTISNKAFSGPIGKIVDKATSFRVKDTIPKINVIIELIELKEEVRNSLSQDQKYLYDITCAIKSGIFPQNLKDRAIGVHDHARWLNLANRLCRAWCSEHTLPYTAAKNLELLVGFIVGVYSPLWFEIKVKHSWIEGQQLELVRFQPPRVKNIVLRYMQSSAWNSHSENLLQALLCSSNSRDRMFAIDMICQLRGRAEFGDRSVRPRKTPKINTNATKLVDLIDWSNDVHEPILTCSMSRNDLLKLRSAPMEVVNFPVHGQSIERCVKEVTRASATVYGEETRDGFIKATLAHRNILPVNESKKDMMNMTQ